MKWEEEQETIAVLARTRALFGALSDLYITFAECGPEEESVFWERLGAEALAQSEAYDRMKDLFRKKKKEFAFLRLPSKIDLEDEARGIEGMSAAVLVEELLPDKFIKQALSIEAWIDGLKLGEMVKGSDEDFKKLNAEAVATIKAHLKELTELDKNS